MRIVNFSKENSLVSQYMTELRDVGQHDDSMRFRNNLCRIAEIMAYEISRTLNYVVKKIETPLAQTDATVIDDEIVLATIFRAGLPFHQGFLNFFDRAQNAFVSAYRKYKERGDFEVCIEYLASPKLERKTLILCDPMLATGISMDMSYRALLTKGIPKKIHLASVVASEQAVQYVSEVFPQESTTLWVGAIDPKLNEHSYIVPGLGDAGDLAFGVKE